jgi:hypothetical protein
MELKQANFDRFKNSELISECVDIQPVKQKVALKLVR